ncbi:hypothetical protein Tco_0946385 [Tanacetum coccineum]
MAFAHTFTNIFTKPSSPPADEDVDDANFFLALSLPIGRTSRTSSSSTALLRLKPPCVERECGDDVANIKRRLRDLSSDGVRELTTASGRNRLKSDL